MAVMARKQKSTEGFGLGQCSLCDHIRLTMGQQAYGGIRYCADCIKQTLMWAQTNEADQAKLLGMYAELEARPDIQAALAVVAAVPEEKRAEIEKAHSIGESRNRLFQSGEHDGTEFLPQGMLR
jgi:hypothetical protein